MLQKLSLLNWKSHSDASLEFSSGINIITGNLGAGKTSILQAITFALFGSLPEIKSRDIKVTDLIKRNEEEAKVQLFLENNSILRQISKKDGTGSATIRDKDNLLLAGPKPTAATEFVEELLKTDLDTFLRTVYAKQNEIDLFLKYSPSDRKKYIDELMKLDKFEKARKYATQLQNKIKVRLDESQQILSSTDKEKLQKAIGELRQELAVLESQKKSSSLDIEKAKEYELAIKQKLNELSEKKSLSDKLEQKVSMLTSQIEQIKSRLKDIIKLPSKSEVFFNIQNLQGKQLEFRKTKNENTLQLEILETIKLALERKLAVLETKKKEFENRDSEVKRLSEELEQINVHKPNLEEDLTSLKLQKEKLSEILQSANLEVNTILEHLAELKASGAVCPICATELSEKSKKELIDKRKKQIITLNKTKSESQISLEKATKEIQELETLLKKKTGLDERLIEVKEICKSIREELIDNNETNEKKVQVHASILELKLQIQTLDQQLEQLQADITTLIEQKNLCDSRDQLDSLIEQLVEAKVKFAEHSIDISALKDAENKYASAIKKSQELTSQLQYMNLLLTEKTKRLEELSQQQKKLEQLSGTISQYQEKIDFLSKFCNALIFTQESLRTDLISTVNEVMSTIWTDLYPYEKWEDIRLLASDNDYNLQLCSTGEWISVAGFASGGERMLAALAMRIAFAKVLAPHLSMLILDEPTHNLDQKAIDTFVEVLQNKLSNYLDQIFIVTHDTKLAEAGKVIEIK